MYTNYDDAYEINHGNNEKEELCEVHELPACNIRRYMMIKYSFNNDEEYVAVKEDEYDDLTITRKEACQAYQEVFRIIDEGWMDFKKDLTVTFDSTKSSIFPPPLLDSDSPFTMELSASITLNSLGNEDKVFKPGILVYHSIHDKNLVTLDKNLRENISSGTLLFLKEPSSPRPPPEPPHVCMRFKPILAMKNDFVKPNEDFYLSETVLSLNVEDVDSFTFIIWTFLPYFTYPEDSPLIFSFRSTDISKITRKPSKTGKHGHEKRKSTKEARDAKPKPGKVKKSKLWSTSSQPWSTKVIHKRTKIPILPFESLKFPKVTQLVL
ncbi:hypothetical protein Tco_0364722 [Tanacetum coccineum]